MLGNLFGEPFECGKADQFVTHKEILFPAQARRLIGQGAVRPLFVKSSKNPLLSKVELPQFGRQFWT